MLYKERIIFINVRLSNEEYLSFGSLCKLNVLKVREGKGFLVSWVVYFEFYLREEIFDIDWWKNFKIFWNNNLKDVFIWFD